MCGKSTSTQTSVQNSLPPELQQAYQALQGFGATVAQQPLQQYQGQLVAGFTPAEQSAFSLANNNAGAWAPYVNSAADYAEAGAQPVWSQIPEYNQANLSAYYDPYQQDVIDSTMAQVQQEDAKALNNLRAQGFLQGNSLFYGDRPQVAGAELAGAQARNRNELLANLRSRGFTNAQQQFGADRDRMLTGLGQDSARNFQAANMMSGLGQGLQSMSLNDITTLLKTGALQRDVAQQQLNVPYQQFQEQQQYPFKIADFMRSLLSGIPTQQTTTTTAPGPNPLAQIAGLGLSLLGLPGSSLGGGLIGGLFGAKRGGRVGFAPGGTPRLNPNDFKSSASFSQPVDFSVGLPQLRIEDAPPPRIYNLPPSIKQALAKFTGAIPWAGPGTSSLGLVPISGPAPGGGSNNSGGGNNNNHDWYYQGYGYDDNYIHTFAHGGAPKKAFGGEDLAQKSLALTGDPGFTQMPDKTAMPAPTAAPPTGGRPKGISPLVFMGLGMMASQRPDFLGAVGEGAQSGLKISEAQRASMDASAEYKQGPDGNWWIIYPDGSKINTMMPAATGGSGSNTFLEYQSQVNKLQQQMDQLNPNDPKRKVLQQQIDQINAKIAKETAAGGGGESSPLGKLMQERDALEAELTRLRISNPNDPRIKQMEAMLAAYDDNIKKTSTNAPPTTQIYLGDNGQKLPEPEKGFVYATDAAGKVIYETNKDGDRVPKQVMIKGGTAEREAAALAAKNAARASGQALGHTIVVDDAKRALEMIEANPELTTGFIGALSQSGGILASGTPGYQVAKTLETVKANIGFEYLQQMRNNSPTGGALGQVSDFENRLLQSVQGSLDLGQQKDEIVFNLNRIIAINEQLEAIAEQLATGKINRDQALAQGEQMLRAIPKRGPLVKPPKDFDPNKQSDLDAFIKQYGKAK